MTASARSGSGCPFCNSNDTELLSLFGAQLLTVQYYCNDCKTPFERVKGPDVLADATNHIRPTEAGTDPPKL